MAEQIKKTLLTKILLRNDVSTTWASVNPILGKGEIGIASDLNQFKIGDGVSTWSELDYFEGNLAGRVGRLEETIEGIISVGGQANVIEGVAVKGEDIVTLDPATKIATIDLDAYAKSADLDAYATTDALATAIADFVTNGALATKLTEYVTLTAYNEKMAALDAEDARIAGLVATEKSERESAISTLTETVNGKVAQGDFDTLSGTVNTLSGTVNTLSQTVADNESDIEEKFAELTKTVGDNKSDIEGKLSALEGTVGSNKTAIEGTVSALDARVVVVENAINGVEGVKGLTEKVNDNASAIAENAGAIAALQTAQAGGLVRSVVEVLPAVGDASLNTIYMIKRSSGLDGNDVYDEYIIVEINGVKQFELLGNTELDLGDYYTKDEIAGLGHATKTYVDEELAKKVNVSDYNEYKATIDPEVAKLAGITGTVAKAIEDAVKVESDRATGVEGGFETRIKALEDKGLADGDVYATKVSVEEIYKVVEGTESGILVEKVAGLQGQLDVIKGADTVDGSIAKAVKDAVAAEAGLRESADNDLAARIAKNEAKLSDVAETETVKALISASEGNVKDWVAEQNYLTDTLVKSVVTSEFNVSEEGQLSINKVNVNKLEQTAGEELILNGGNASGALAE